MMYKSRLLRGPLKPIQRAGLQLLSGRDRTNDDEIMGAKFKDVVQNLPAFRDGPSALDPKRQALRLGGLSPLLKDEPTIERSNADRVVLIRTFRTAPGGERERP